MKRVLKKRATELLDRVSSDEAGEIGSMFPQRWSPPSEQQDQIRSYNNRMKELGYSRDEADELLRYSRQ